MPIVFPTNPTVGQQFTYGGVTYSYTAQNVWLARAAGLAIATQAEAIAGTRNDVLMTPQRVSQYTPQKIAFSAVPNVDQSGIASETWTKVLFQTAVFNDSNLYNTSTSRWTPPNGKVQISAGVYYNTGVLMGTPIFIAIYKNGGLYRHNPCANVSSSQSGAHIAIIDSCNGTDYYELFTLLYSGSTATLNAASGGTFFMGTTL